MSAPESMTLPVMADAVNLNRHLSARQVGAFTLLLQHLLQTGRLPEDERELAQIARLSVSVWRRERSRVLVAVRSYAKVRP